MSRGRTHEAAPADRAGAPPTLTRRTPSAATCASERQLGRPSRQQQVHRFGRRPRRDDRGGNITAARANARRVRAIGARAFGIRLQSRNRLTRDQDARRESTRRVPPAAWRRRPCRSPAAPRCGSSRPPRQHQQRGRCASPVQILDREAGPATPASTARADALLRPPPASRATSRAFEIGIHRATPVAARRRSQGDAQDLVGATCRRSARPWDHANPELVVAGALNPRPCRSYSALPTSHGFGMTKQPASCSWWKARRFSATVGRDPGHAHLLHALGSRRTLSAARRHRISTGNAEADRA